MELPVSDDLWTNADTEWHEVVFECLMPEACVNKTNATTPNAAYACNETKGYRANGTLCASCLDDFFYKNKRCARCDEAALSSSAQTAIGVVAGLLVLWLLVAFGAKQRAASMLSTMHWLRHQTKRRIKRRRRRQRRGRHQSRSSSGAEEDADGSVPWLARWSNAISLAAIRSAHRFVKAARDNQVSLGETSKIVINSAKVCSHLYGTLTYCLSFPGAMVHLMSIANLLAFDVVAQTKMPCWPVRILSDNTFVD